MLRALWLASESLLPHECAFVRLLMPTGQRRDIIAKLQWSEVRLQEEIPHFLFKQTRSKNSRAYMLPITPQILDVLQSLKRFEGFDYVTAVPGNDGRPLSAFTHVKEKLVPIMQRQLEGRYYDWRFHDLRRVMKSGMAQLGVDGRVSELCLAHSPSWETKVEPHYNVYGYVLEKTDAMRRYNEYLMRTIFPERYTPEERAKDELTAKLAKVPADKLATLLELLRN